VNPEENSLLKQEPSNTNPEVVPAEETQNSLKQIRTYQGDIAEALRAQNESIVSIQRMEQTRREEKQAVVATHSAHKDNPAMKALLFGLGSVILMGLTGLGGWYSYLEFTKRMAPPAVAVPISRLIPSAQSVDIDSTALNRRALIDAITSEQTTTLPNGDVKHVVLRTNVVLDGVPTGETTLTSTSELFRILETKAPGHLVRSFQDTFMLGMLESNPASVFMIIKLASFENTFSGMLSWEKDIARDIGPIFATWGVMQTNTSASVFQDVIVRNKDVRILYDESGALLLLYTYLDNNTLIITDNIGTLNIITNRLTLERLAQ
jgi:hypothetical protein